MKLLTQPGDGIEPLIKAIGKAKKSVEILIFRFDHREMETALANAAKRGVKRPGSHRVDQQGWREGPQKA
jgi:phosphatidylserine/phosphatidylglycerophosphate/cardiolipin synthase-like enzyme